MDKDGNGISTFQNNMELRDTGLQYEEKTYVRTISLIEREQTELDGLEDII